MQAYFGNQRISEGELFTFNEAQKDINVYIPEDILATLIIYDITTSPHFIHTIIENIRNNDINTGNVVLSYLPPSPPSGKHEYIIKIYQQNKSFKDAKSSDRHYDIDTLIRKNKLDEVSELSFLVSSSSLTTEIGTKETVRKEYSERHPRYEHHFEENFSDSDLDENEKKYCSCVLDVMGKDTYENIRNRTWGKGTGAYNPYAVCSSRIERHTRPECFKKLDYKTLPEHTLKVLAAYFELDQEQSREDIIAQLDEIYKLKQ